MVSSHLLREGRQRKEGKEGGDILLKYGLRENVLKMVSLDTAPANPF